MSDTPPNPDHVYSSVAELARWLHRDAVRVRLVIEYGDGGRTVIGCPLPDATGQVLSDHARRILEFLQRFADANYVKRSVVASVFDGELDPDGTPFKEALAELSSAGLIESKGGPNGGIRERR